MGKLHPNSVTHENFFPHTIYLNHAIARVTYPLRILHRSASGPTVVASASKNITLYENLSVRPGYFRLIAIVSGIQLLFWGYLSVFAFTELQEKTHKQSDSKTEWTLTAPADSVLEDEQKGSWYTSLKWRMTFSLLALSAGIFFGITACMYPLRVVQKLCFLKPSSVCLTTYTPMGTKRALEVPLTNITCSGDRLSERAQLALKVKGYPLFFLVDKQGQFWAPRLFDTLIASRKKVL